VIVFRRIGRIAKWCAIAVLLPVSVAVQIGIVTILFFPLDPAELAPRGTPLTLVDRNGQIIAVVAGANPDRDHWAPLTDVPAIAVSAVIASEDAGFWDHRGVDGRGILRAIALDLRERRLGFGGSTLTMQVARLVLHTENTRTARNKVREALYALRIERAIDKRAILEQWFNRAYFGNGAYGIDAAAQRYFGKPAIALSDGEAAFLAVLPRAPRTYDPLVHPDAATRRRDRVLDMLVRRGSITADDAARAKATPLAIGRHAPQDLAPHFVGWVVDSLPPEVRARGGRVETTLDLGLQRLVERRLREHLATLDDRNVDQAGAVVLDTATSEVLAMVGSPAWNGPDGQVNITTRRRHPGSALKPFVYASAIELGDSPASIAFDVREGVDADHATRKDVEHGPERYRMALAGSHNYAAMDVLERAGEARVMSALRAAGVAELEGVPDDYGSRLALGAAKVRLIDLAAGYGFLVRGGAVRAATGVRQVKLVGGGRWRPRRATERRVFSPTTAWLTMDILSDPEARRATFGAELPFDLPYRVAAKTGTARGFADTWAVAATREVIAAAWAGNFDGAPSQGVVAMDGAAPIVRDALLAYAGGRRLSLPPRPNDIDGIEVCAVSGLLPGPNCPHAHDHVKHGTAPTAPCDWHVAGTDGVVNWPTRALAWHRRQHPPLLGDGRSFRSSP
jgi:penicillin-binding protein 1C